MTGSFADARRCGRPKTATDEGMSTQVLAAMARSSTKGTILLSAQKGIRQLREKQAEEQKSHIRELDRIYRADGRENESADEIEQRRSEDRLGTIARRNNMSAEETQQRHSDDRFRASARRNSMTTEETEERRSEN
ncbi:hypothetical protein AVEN_96033-1 [Araneus ventricosus]|uniref:Uncharacterized protein n=1 Tax=Araneus ventricosus TaxID=182803 RepID=A0A4Y2B668_ARAVE|nr:hypothetical protein AVEN_96033-1 [Araneus ventricosus]